MPAPRSRLALTVALAALCLVPGGSGAVDGGSSVAFAFFPERAFQGQPAAVAVHVRPKGTRCTAQVRYFGGATQGLGSARARTGRATWRWTVPPKARLGQANLTIACGSAGRNSRVFTVTGPPSAPARVVVEKQGFSQRVRFTTRDVSFGVVLSNPTPDKDALDVNVLVNFVDATNRVVATTSTTIPGVRAEARFYHGGSTTIPDGTPVSKLEVVTRIGSQAVGQLRGPALDDVQVLAALWDPGYVGAVQGQLRNDHATQLLTNTQISAVVFDAAGNVIGGGTGYASAPMLPGVRSYFQANGGVGAIPIDRAAGAGVSAVGSYQQVG